MHLNITPRTESFLRDALILTTERAELCFITNNSCHIFLVSTQSSRQKHLIGGVSPTTLLKSIFSPVSIILYDSYTAFFIIKALFSTQYLIVNLFSEYLHSPIKLQTNESRIVVTLFTNISPGLEQGLAGSRSSITICRLNR